MLVRENWNPDLEIEYIITKDEFMRIWYKDGSTSFHFMENTVIPLDEINEYNDYILNVSRNNSYTDDETGEVLITKTDC